MPDPHKQTISATQSPGLFGVSPYVTRWMLYRHFATGEPLDEPENERMYWGRRMQPLILDTAAADLRLEVRPNEHYVRRGLLGCTRDAVVICPDRGPGTLETKCVFDYGVWMDAWGGGKAPPRHVEIQTQQQMLVGDGDDAPAYQWGVLAVWVCGEVHYFERQPVRELWNRLNEEALALFADVEVGREPDPFGAPPESDWLTRLFSTDASKVVDLSAHPDAVKLVEKAALYKYHKAEESAHGKGASALRTEFLALMKDASEALLPGGARIRITTRNMPASMRKASTSKTLTVYVPDGAAALGSSPKREPMLTDLAGG